MPRIYRRAEFVQTLVYADEPQVVLLVAGDAKIIAVAVDTETEGMWFFAVSVSKVNWAKYKRGAVDLRYLFLYAQPSRHFTFDLSIAKENRVRMNYWNDPIPEEFIPSPRFFATDHTEDDIISIGQSVQILGVDGEWDLPDFSRLYSVYSDIYSFSNALSEYKSIANDNVKRRIADAFSDYPWRGGFSSVHFYDHLYAAQPIDERLSVRRIKYASPGQIDVIGQESTFKNVKEIITNFIENRHSIAEKYNAFHGYLSKLKLLNAPATRSEIEGPLGDRILADAKSLAQSLLIEDFSLIHDLAQGRTLIAAKIVLSFFRRVERAFLFFAEGRVDFAENPVSLQQAAMNFDRA